MIFYDVNLRIRGHIEGFWWRKEKKTVKTHVSLISVTLFSSAARPPAPVAMPAAQPAPMQTPKKIPAPTGPPPPKPVAPIQARPVAPVQAQPAPSQERLYFLSWLQRLSPFFSRQNPPLFLAGKQSYIGWIVIFSFFSLSLTSFRWNDLCHLVIPLPVSLPYL